VERLVGIHPHRHQGESELREHLVSIELVANSQLPSQVVSVGRSEELDLTPADFMWNLSSGVFLYRLIPTEIPTSYLDRRWKMPCVRSSSTYVSVIQIF
jgi:hypothetical protein